MRETWFRGIDKTYNIANGYLHNVWRYGSLIEYDSGQMAIVGSADRYGMGLFTNEVIPETVGQFTGFRDKLHENIYEGDILIDEVNNETHVVYYDVNTAQFTTKDLWLWSLVKHPYYSKIVGNIHDDKGILEVK